MKPWNRLRPKPFQPSDCLFFVPDRLRFGMAGRGDGPARLLRGRQSSRKPCGKGRGGRGDPACRRTAPFQRSASGASARYALAISPDLHRGPGTRGACRSSGARHNASGFSAARPDKPADDAGVPPGRHVKAPGNAAFSRCASRVGFRRNAPFLTTAALASRRRSVKFWHVADPKGRPFQASRRKGQAMTMRKVASAIATPAICLLLLAGCGVEDGLDEMANERYAATCSRTGMAPGSPDFNSCMLQQQRLEAQSVSNATGLQAAEAIARKEPPWRGRR